MIKGPTADPEGAGSRETSRKMFFPFLPSFLEKSLSSCSSSLGPRFRCRLSLSIRGRIDHEIKDEHLDLASLQSHVIIDRSHEQ